MTGGSVRRVLYGGLCTGWFVRAGSLRVGSVRGLGTGVHNPAPTRTPNPTRPTRTTNPLPPTYDHRSLYGGKQRTRKKHSGRGDKLAAAWMLPQYNRRPRSYFPHIIFGFFNTLHEKLVRGEGDLRRRSRRHRRIKARYFFRAEEHAGNSCSQSRRPRDWQTYRR